MIEELLACVKMHCSGEGIVYITGITGDMEGIPEKHFSRKKGII